MIPYHGTPLKPDDYAIRLLDGKHAFVSFANPQQIEIVAEYCQSFALDNGAYPPWTRGEKYDFQGYNLFCAEWLSHNSCDWAIIPDIIDGSLADNKKLIKDWEFCISQSVPVWHLHEPLGWLLELCQDFPVVAFGSSGEFAVVGTPAWWHRIADAFHYISVDGRPISKIHGLRMLDPKYRIFPFHSADSTNLARHQNDASRIYPNRTPKMNGSIMMYEIEKSQSARCLASIPNQKGLFTAHNFK